MSRVSSIASSSSSGCTGRPPIPLPRLSIMSRSGVGHSAFGTVPEPRGGVASDDGRSSLRRSAKPVPPKRQIDQCAHDESILTNRDKDNRDSSATLAAEIDNPKIRRKPRHPSVENPEYMSLIDFRSLAGMSTAGSDPFANPDLASTSQGSTLTTDQLADLLSELDPLSTPRQNAGTDPNFPVTGRQESVYSVGTISLATTHFNSGMVLDEEILNSKDYSGMKAEVNEYPVYVNECQISEKSDASDVNRHSLSNMELLDGLEFLPRGSICPAPPTTPTGQNICYSAWLWVQQLQVTGESAVAKSRPAKRWWCTLKDGRLAFTPTDLEPDAPGKFLLDCSSVLYIGTDGSAPAAGPQSPNLSTASAAEPSTSANSSSSYQSYVGNNWLQRMKKSFDSMDNDCNNSQCRLVLFYRNQNSGKVLGCMKLIAESQVERDSWMLLISKACAPGESSAELIDSWRRAWAQHHQTSLVYKFLDTTEESVFECDLRKILRLTPKVSAAAHKCEECNTAGGVDQIDNCPVLMSFSGCSLYLQAEWTALTHRWLSSIVHIVCNTPLSQLHMQRVTADCVPVIVDRCIDFIAVHGAQLEGVYRKSGPASQVRLLMEAFRGDPSDFVLRKDSDETVFCVAEALRRYFRQLDEPLFTFEHRATFYDAFSFPEADLDKKIAFYKDALGRLPAVNYATLRKLCGHLREIAEHSAVNKATISNIAKIFGPTLMTVDGELESSSCPLYTAPTSSSTKNTVTANGNGSPPAPVVDYSQYAARIQEQIRVVFDLIAHYNAVFDVSDSEIAHRARVHRQLGELQQGDGCFPKKQAGCMLVPIHVFEKENQAFNTESVNSAQTVVDFAVMHRNLPHEQGPYALFETARDGQLERLVWPEEGLLGICIERWYRWEKEIAGLYLIIKADTWTKRLADVDPYPFAVDVRFADKGSKSFKKASFKLAQGELCFHKDNKQKHVAKKWQAENLLWYFGCETKREPPTQFVTSQLFSHGPPIAF